MSILLLDDGNGVVDEVDAIGIELSSAKMSQLQREGRVEWTERGGLTVVVGHEEALESLVAEVKQ